MINQRFETSSTKNDLIFRIKDKLDDHIVFYNLNSDTWSLKGTNLWHKGKNLDRFLTKFDDYIDYALNYPSIQKQQIQKLVNESYPDEIQVSDLDKSNWILVTRLSDNKIYKFEIGTNKWTSSNRTYNSKSFEDFLQSYVLKNPFHKEITTFEDAHTYMVYRLRQLKVLDDTNHSNKSPKKLIKLAKKAGLIKLDTKNLTRTQFKNQLIDIANLLSIRPAKMQLTKRVRIQA